MAVYKVPQDVEADDKLLGPFSFRQFIYLIIVALAGGMAWLLSQIFIGLVIIPAPVIILFTALALPLKKDQPMEAYLGAMISFYFIKPRKRLWQPDGIESLVEITAPKTVEPDRVKDITGDEAKERLGYLTDIVESRGWSVRGVGVPMDGTSSMNTHLVEEAKTAVDMFDDSDREAQKFDQLIKERREHTVQELSARMQSGDISHQAPPMSQSQHYPPATPEASLPSPTTPPVQQVQPSHPQVEFNPYPQNIRQSVVQPLSPEHTAPTPQSSQQNPANIPPPLQEEPQSTSDNAPSPGIIKLAKESDGLTVADVARQAQRITNRERGLPEEEVQISLH